MIELKHLMTYRAELAQPVDVGVGPSGWRQIFDVTGGHFEGPRLRGKVLASGGDWLLVGDGGVGRLDVRATFETDDGAHIYLQYHGILIFNDHVTRALSEGVETQYGDTYFMASQRFETGHADYAWLNAVVALGQGRVLPSAVEYRVFEVCNA